MYAEQGTKIVCNLSMRREDIKAKRQHIRVDKNLFMMLHFFSIYSFGVFSKSISLFIIWDT